MTLVCPYCRTPLEIADSGLTCTGCGRTYPVDRGIADFAEGRYYDRFDSQGALAPEHVSGLRAEEAGAESRVHYYLPLLPPAPARILDCGTGNGMSVDLLSAAGYEAWGVDSSQLRKWQWRERQHPERLVVADALRLPFADHFFDVVIASGVLEHIGVAEGRDPEYHVRPLPDRDEQRIQFLHELLRATDPSGAIFLDFPNAWFPIDFWHGTTPGSARFHTPWEGFLPSLTYMKRLVGRISPEIDVTTVSLHGRLRFRQVAQHWYGRMFAGPVSLLVRALGRSALSPFLVVRITSARRR